MRAFWRMGYDGASIDDLTAETGLKRGSLYNAFGDKDAMYREALELYWEEVSGPIRGALSDPDPIRAIRRMLDENIARMSDHANPLGCLSTQAGLDLAGRSDPLARLVRDSHAAFEASMEATLSRARTEGRIPPDVDVKALARFFHGVVRGMAAMHRASGDVDAARDMADVAMKILEKETPNDC